MEKTNSLKVMIGTFVVLMIAIAFLMSIADQTSNVVDKTNVADETTDLSAVGCLTGDGQVNESSDACVVTVTNYPTSWRVEDCPLTNVVVSNDTTALTLDTDYTLDASAGTVTFLNTTATENGTMGNNALIDYSYCGDNYMNSSWGRNILGVNVGIYAIAILLIVIGAAYMVLNRRED